MAFEFGRGNFFIRGQKGSLTAGKYKNKKKGTYKGIRLAKVESSDVPERRTAKKKIQGVRKRFGKALFVKTEKKAKGSKKSATLKKSKSPSPDNLVRRAINYVKGKFTR